MSSEASPSRLPPRFYRLLAANVSTNLGDGVLTVALPWLASAVTRDPLLIAVAALAGRLPWLLFTLPAGVIADRYDRRMLVVGSDIARALIMLGFALVVLGTTAGNGSTEHTGLLLGLLYATSLLTGFAEVLRDNTAQTFMPAIVPRAQLQLANGRLWGVETVSNQFIGPPLAGFLIGVIAGLPFLTSAGLYAIGAALVLAIRGGFAPRAPLDGRSSAPWQSQLIEGWRHLWRDDLLRPLAITLGVLNGATAISGAIFVLFAQEVLGVGAQAFGLLMTGFAAGAVTGSLLANRVMARLPPGTWLMLSIAVIGLGQLATGLASSAPLVWVASFTVGALVMVWNIITVSLRQTIIPDRLLGRVNSVYRFFGWGTISIGSLLGGALTVVAEPLVGREWALRTPFLMATVLLVTMLIYAAPRLTTARMEAAKEAARISEGAVDASG